MQQRSTIRRIAGVGVTSGALLLSALVASPSGAAAPSDAPDACDNRANNTYRKILECTQLGGARQHQRALQRIADANGGTRAEQTPGYTASVDYVMETLAAAGWEAERVPFTYDGTELTLKQLRPTEEDWGTGGVTGTAEGSRSGPVTAVDINLDGDRASTSGCEASDFDGLDFTGDNDIALIQRGTCPFSDKVANAQDAGAEAVIIFNQGNSAEREDVLDNITLGDLQADIPVIGTSFEAGQSLAVEGSRALVEVKFVDIVSENVIAELPGKVDDNVVMAGAHLDSVPAGPGINDNGSGSAGLLEVAQAMGNVKPHNTVRMAWWGAEEIGLIGSTEWVEQRSEAELAEIALYLNFDMIGSPNYVFQVYDANQSTFEAPVDVPEGSEAIETLFERFYSNRSQPYDDSAFSGRSDYQAFIEAGIPSGGLFTGAETIKTEEQAGIWGGTAGDQFDPCYHLACDTYANNSNKALFHNIDSVAYSVLTYAYSTEKVNGVEGKKIPGGSYLKPAAGPEGTFAGETDGGAAPHDHASEASSE